VLAAMVALTLVVSPGQHLRKQIAANLHSCGLACYCGNKPSFLAFL
jgi:hypothetical protein